MKKLLVLLCVLGGCALPDKTYTIDGVPVVLENRIGPKRDQMVLTVELFRREVEDRWVFTTDEQSVWQSLQEIRWVKHPVLDHAHYDQEVSVVYANWFGCALNVPFYAALLYHYVGEPTEEDLAWADALHDRNAPVICTGGWEFPW